LDDYTAAIRSLGTVDTRGVESFRYSAIEWATGSPTAARVGEVWTSLSAGGMAAEAMQVTKAVVASSPEMPPSVFFGQRRIDPVFSTKVGVPEYLAGRRISDVANDLRAGVLSPDQLPISAFVYDSGQLISINNRTLAALSEAGMRPSIINIVSPTRNQLLRLTEAPIINSPIPGPLIPVTPSQRDLDIMYIIATRW
jgi:hypothetical protein